jgi:transcription-repair coupling factor (superfamily II helicase)
MLKEAIEERQTDTPREKKIDVEIDLQVDAYLPQEYISDGRQKIDMYKRFRAITSLVELEELQEEIVDRFGEYPVEVDYLFQIAKIKVFAIQERVELINQDKAMINFLIEEEASNKIDGHSLFDLSNKYNRMVGLGMDGGRLKITVDTKGHSPEKWLGILTGNFFELRFTNRVLRKGLLVANLSKMLKNHFHDVYYITCVGY